MTGLNAQQEKIRDFILDFQREHGRRPTYAEIKEALQIGSLDTVHRCVEKLGKMGLLVLLYVVPPNNSKS